MIIIYLSDSNRQVVRMTFEDSYKRAETKHLRANGGGPIQYLIISTSGNVYGKRINSKELPPEVTEPREQFPSAPLGIVITHLTGTICKQQI